MDLASRIRSTIREHALIEPGGRVIVALSGGPDSVALLHLLRELQAAGDLTVVGAAHFNHLLRGTEADEDEAFCRTTTEALDLPIEVGRADVRRFAKESHRSVEDAGRVLRYQFLEGAADRLGADAIAVAHSRDDQAETFLLRLMRGSGPRGLTGIRPRIGRVVRPLLVVSRSDLRQYLADHGLAFREDSSNHDLTIPRNRVRHELIPYIEREFSPAVVELLAREAAIARDDEDCLTREAIDLTASVVLTNAGRNGLPETRQCEIEVARLEGLSAAHAARVARELLSRLAAGRFVGFEHLERFLRFARNGKVGSAVSLPGQRAVHRGGTVVLEPEPPRGRSAGPENSFRFPLSIPGEVVCAGGWAITAEPLEAVDKSGTYWRAKGEAVVVASKTLSLPLAVRSRKAGDRFRPLGLGGRRAKLQDFFVNRRVPRSARDRVPLVVDSDDRIVWVVGETVAEDFRVTDPAQGVILLKVRRLGGPG